MLEYVMSTISCSDDLGLFYQENRTIFLSFQEQNNQLNYAKKIRKHEQ